MRRTRILRVAELIPGPVAAVRAETATLPRRIGAAIAELPVGVLVTLEERRSRFDLRPRWLALGRLNARLSDIDRRSSRLIVVAAAIIRNHHVLVAQRDHPSEWAGRWEFPGGKVERGETPQAGLIREIGEELGAAIEVGPELARHELRDGAQLRLYQATLAPGSPEPTPREHQALEWVRPPELNDREWAGTNSRFVTDVTGRL